jgi:hypothetical protein
MRPLALTCFAVGAMGLFSIFSADPLNGSVAYIIGTVLGVVFWRIEHEE